MSDIIKSNKGAKIKAQTSVSKRRVNLADANTITESMLRDSVVTTNKIADANVTTVKIADLNNVRLIDSGNSNHLQLQSDSTPDQTADRILSVDSENLAAILRLQGLAKVLPCESYLISSDLKNITTAYGYHLNTTDPTVAWIGGVTLTESGAVGSSTDHLGNTADCDFGGAAYLYKVDDAAFSWYDSFDVSFWAYRSDWSITFTADICGRMDAVPNGWAVTCNAGLIYLHVQAAGVQRVRVPITHTALASGWHHFHFNYNASDGKCYGYVDNKWAAFGQSGGTFTPTSSLAFTIGARAGGVIPFTGRIAEVLVHRATSYVPYTENEIQKVYSRGSRHFAAKQADGSITIPQNETIFYPQRSLTITENSPGGSGVSTVGAVGIPYKDILGNWRLIFNINLTTSVARTNLVINIVGVTFGTFNQPVVINSAQVGSRGSAVASGATIDITSLSTTFWQASGDVALASQPNI